MINVGVDLGGTKIEAIALGPTGLELARQRVATPDSYSACLGEIKGLVDRVLATARRHHPQVGALGYTVGIGTPGTFDPGSGRMRNANTVWLNDREFRSDLERVFDREVRISNDANCLALSETLDGAAEDAQTAFALILGTGCGGGLVSRKCLIEGHNGLAGEWGHIPLPWVDIADGTPPECWCGKRGCIETWVSGTGFSRDFAERGGRRLTAEAIIALAEDGDRLASECFEAFLSRLGRALALIANIVDPDVFVFGGGLSNVGAIYQRLPEHIRAHVFGGQWEGKLLKARHGDSSGVRGAALLWRQGAPVTKSEIPAQ
ncbi:MAG TPA: ROK family protein [Asticcacaulis sp.]|nr:ROK family protein [Asticcacaulis sp.]